ncbi:hypothetical protein ACFVU2_20365 [Leifsonia sp. NPDC058194]|uniref:hypothetical protein n=1 Tax=Leifsonia sp. NPDC058194 TaxID=3346374 RepID=UPI0036DDAA71
MSAPATSGVALPDAFGGAIRTWRIIGVAALVLAILGAFAVLALLFVALYAHDYAPLLVSGLVTAVLAVVGIVSVFVVLAKQSDQRNALSDALTLGGHPGVDVRRLQAGRPVPSPQGVELRLRREKDDAGAPWLLVDAYAYAPRPTA